MRNAKNDDHYSLTHSLGHSFTHSSTPSSPSFTDYTKEAKRSVFSGTIIIINNDSNDDIRSYLCHHIAHNSC